MYKPHNAKIDVYYMNIVALLFMGAFAAFILWGHVGTGAKYFLLKNFGISSIGTVAKIEHSVNLSLKTRVHLTLREYSSSAYFFKYDGRSGKQYENSLLLLDNFKENKFPKKGEPKFTRTHVYEIGQSEEIKYLEKWPQVFLTLSYLAPLQFDMKVMLGSLFTLLVFVVLILLNIRSLLKFRKTNKNY